MRYYDVNIVLASTSDVFPCYSVCHIAGASMKLLKPSWMNLDGKPLFAVDIHPEGLCVATGGMGEDCGRIVIWNMAPIRSERDEEDQSVPKVLCELTNHEACVNTLRWSPDGKSLASGE